MYRRSSSIFAERVRASLSRRDPGAMVNELTERVVSATLSQGMVTDKEDFEWCLRRLIVPPSLAYGVTRSGAIPANATLVFEVSLLSVAVPGS